jgi:hypothetical protein
MWVIQNPLILFHIMLLWSMSRAILPKPAEADPYSKFLNHKIEARLYDGARVVGTLTNASPYALLLDTPAGSVIINKAFLVSVVRLE